MARFTIDLRCKYIRPDQQIWRLFPGSGYAFLEDYVKGSMVFLEMPGFPLPADVLAEDDSTLNRRINIGDTLETWAFEHYRNLRLGRSQDLKPRPSADLQAYPGAISRNLQTRKSAIKGLYGEAKQGDLLVVPAPLSSRLVWIAEFVDSPGEVTTVEVARYGPEQIPARRVRWFDPVNEGKFSTGMSLRRDLRQKIICMPGWLPPVSPGHGT